MDKKQIYDLDNRNVASQNVKLGTLLNAIEQGTEKPLNELTKKQIYDLTNDTVTTQKIRFGDIIDALAKGDTSTIDDLTEEQIKAVNTIDIACQKVELGKGLNVLIEQGKKSLVRESGLYKTGTDELTKSWAQLLADGDITITDGALMFKNISLAGDLVCDNVEGITSMNAAFMGAERITSIDLSRFDASRVVDVGYMITKCLVLTKVDISSFSFANVTESDHMIDQIPVDCEILVKDEAAKTFINTNFPTFTNVKIKA